MTSVSVDCKSGDELALRTTLLFAQPRASKITHEAWGCPLVEGSSRYSTLELDNSFAPACAFNFEMRPAGGSLPVSGAENPELLMWVPHLDAQGVDPAVALIALADSLPPAAMTCFIEPAAISSASWTIDLPQPRRGRRMVSHQFLQPTGLGGLLVTGYGDLGRKRSAGALGAPDRGDFCLVQKQTVPPPLQLFLES